MRWQLRLRNLSQSEGKVASQDRLGFFKITCCNCNLHTAECVREMPALSDLVFVENASVDFARSKKGFGEVRLVWIREGPCDLETEFPFCLHSSDSAV